MRLRPEQFVARGLHMGDLACKCDDKCTHKGLDDAMHPRSFLFFWRVAQLLEEYALRVKVNSALRCPVHNATIGGSPDSAHIYMVAADLEPEGPVYDLAILAERMACFSGILVYPHAGDKQTGVLHLDMHPNDRVVRGYSFGPKNNHFLRWGSRHGSPLEEVTEWNVDYNIQPPAYIREALQRERP